MPVWYREEPDANGDAVEIFRGTVWEMAMALDAAKQEIERLLEGIRYWSYCMDIGMRDGCPEKVEELMNFLMSCKIAPYHMARVR